MRAPRVLVVVTVLGVLAAACDGGGNGTSDASDDGGSVQTACSPARDATSGSETRTVDHDGLDRTYVLSVPESYDGDVATPVIVNMHGLSSTAEQQNLLSNMPGAGGERGYIVVAPQGEPATIPFPSGAFTTNFWNVADVVDSSGVDAQLEGAVDDIGFLGSVMDDLEQELCIDTDREYATGLSNGAAMAVALACVDSERWAAIAPVAGANFVTECDPSTPVSMVNIHGTADMLAPYEGGGTLGFDLGLPGVVDETAGFAERGGCAAEPTVEQIGEDVEFRQWPDCRSGIGVDLYTVLEGGHTWPGADVLDDVSAGDDGSVSDTVDQDVPAEFDLPLDEIIGHTTDTIAATDVILDFFDAHTRTT